MGKKKKTFFFLLTIFLLGHSSVSSSRDFFSRHSFLLYKTFSVVLFLLVYSCDVSILIKVLVPGVSLRLSPHSLFFAEWWITVISLSHLYRLQAAHKTLRWSLSCVGGGEGEDIYLNRLWLHKRWQVGTGRHLGDKKSPRLKIPPFPSLILLWFLPCIVQRVWALAFVCYRCSRAVNESEANNNFILSFIFPNKISSFSFFLLFLVHFFVYDQTASSSISSHLSWDVLVSQPPDRHRGERTKVARTCGLRRHNCLLPLPCQRFKKILMGGFLPFFFSKPWPW